MLIIGSDTNFKNPDELNSLILEHNLIIFGANEAGKTTLFESINKWDENYDSYQDMYQDINKKILLISDNKIGYINQKGEICKIKRIESNIFDKESIKAMTQLDCNIYAKQFSKNPKITKKINLVQNNDCKIKSEINCVFHCDSIHKNNCNNQNVNSVSKFIYTYDEFKDIITINLKIFENKTEKDQCKIFIPLLLNFKLFRNTKISQEEEDAIIKLRK